MVSVTCNIFQHSRIFTRVLYRAMLHNEKVYPKPEEFIPERFLNEHGQIDLGVQRPDVACFGFGRRYVIFAHSTPMTHSDPQNLSWEAHGIQ